MAGAIVDTDVLIGVLRQHRPTMTRLAELYSEMDLSTTTVTAFELFGGRWAGAQADAIGTLLGTMSIIPLDIAAGVRAGLLDRELRTSGLRLETGDTLIAGIALANSMPLITGNVRHFDRVPELAVIALRP